MQLLELKLKNVVPFHSATLDLSYPGITKIHGLNRDGAPGTTNAAGKSALAGAIADLVLSEPPSGKSDKVKDIKVKKSSITVSLMRGKRRYDITKMMGKGKSYEILEDGKSTDVQLRIVRAKFARFLVFRKLSSTRSSIWTEPYRTH